MAHVLLLLIAAVVVGIATYGVTWLITGRDRGLDPEEPDGRAVPLPTNRPLFEADIQTVRFDTTLRGYRMDQVDATMRRTAYDVGYKDELISVLEAELTALRENRLADADALRAAREGTTPSSHPAEGDDAAGTIGTPSTGPEAGTDGGADTVASADAEPITVTDAGRVPAGDVTTAGEAGGADTTPADSQTPGAPQTPAGSQTPADSPAPAASGR